VQKTTIKLADGRQLSYYDATAGQARDAVDRRELPSANTPSQLRYEPFLDTWVIYASHRQNRSYLPSARECPLCLSTGGHLTEIPAADYEVVVFENRFLALSASRAPAAAVGGSELLPQRPGGRCEVVCYTPDHDASFAKLSRERVELVLRALIDRTAELSALPGVDQVFCFENRGREIGVTQPHPHGQIYAYPFVTPRTDKALASARAYYRRTGRNLFDDVLAAERADGSRVMLATEYWTAFVPQAARWPCEIHLYPNRRAGRDRHPGIRGLVQPPAPLRNLRRHPARRTRDRLLPSERQPHRGRPVTKLSLRTCRGDSRARAENDLSWTS
jgi:UDPglucose--hexose-1-phosphate uridylyltransferase